MGRLIALLVFLWTGWVLVVAVITACGGSPEFAAIFATATLIINREAREVPGVTQ